MKAGVAGRLAAVAVLAVVAAGQAGGAGPAGASVTGPATSPGSPGTPQPGTPVYTEDLSNETAPSPVHIHTYRGSPGTASGVTRSGVTKRSSPSSVSVPVTPSGSLLVAKSLA